MTTLEHIPLYQLQPSPTNPRKTFDESKLAELATSIAQHGILEPILVRAHEASAPLVVYEVVAGERRYRAAQLAQVETVPCLIRELSDREVLEIQVVENLQRDDLHPLEEADGYSRLIKTAGYDVAMIAERIGRSEKYVYDRVKLLQLVPELRTVFLGGEITASHAILLARLGADDQRRCLESEGRWGQLGGLFTNDQGHDDQLDIDELSADDLTDEEAEAVDARRNRKPVSVRELNTWINDHVRFRPEAEDLPNLFPETQQALEVAVEEKLKVVHITRDYQLKPETRTEGQRTYSRRSWKRADGGPDNDGWGAPKPSKECDHRVMGVVVAGPGRGEAFYVCIAKKKCAVHWAEEQRAANERGAPNGAGTKTGRDTYAEQERRRREEWKRQDAERARWKKAAPKLLEALAEKLAAAPASELVSLVVDHCKGHGSAPKQMKRGKALEDAVRYAAFLILAREVQGWRASVDGPRALKPYGINAKKIVDEVAPKPKEKKAAKKKAPKKKAAAKKRRAKKSADVVKGGTGV